MDNRISIVSLSKEIVGRCFAIGHEARLRNELVRAMTDPGLSMVKRIC